MDKPLTVTEISLQIKFSLESTFNEVLIEGEISNLTSSQTGHWYFTVSDEESSLSVALFKQDAFRNPIIKQIKNGDKIVIAGGLGVYTKRGTYQLIAKKIFNQGQGILKEQFERLKQKLSVEGLFDLEKKKSIPRFPKKIALVTALGAAALQDFLNITMRRSFSYHLTIVPCLVQGQEAAKSIIDALSKAEKLENVELIVVMRGGGSYEDLFVFNDEKIVRKIAQIEIPVISAIGHQVDFTLCDFVADLRCETPSAAAEIVSQAQMEVAKELQHIHSRLKSNMINRCNDFIRKLERFSPMRNLQKLNSKLGMLNTKLSRLNLKNRDHELLGLHQIYLQIDDAVTTLIRLTQEKLTLLKFQMQKDWEKLKVLDPNQVLSRGFSIISDEKGHIIDSVAKFDKIKKDQSILLKLKDGIGHVKKY